MYPFTIGHEYVRSDLLEFVGSRQLQTGVIWGPREPGCLIITSGGRHGKKVGYSDQPLKDGCWWYFGQGQNGDHEVTRAANKILIDGERSILLFTTREPTANEVRERGNYRKLFAFQGVFNTFGYEVVIPVEGSRKGDKLLRFHLVPVDIEGFRPEVPPILRSTDILSLRQTLIEQTQPSIKPNKMVLTEYRLRSAKVRRYAILRAKGKCEGCGCPPPFIDDQGNGFLEVHHILRMADDGVDAPQNVAAICPNCHRRAHYSVDRESFKQHLLAAILSAESDLG